MTDPMQLPLRDIHLPEPVSWWPPAAGWWIVLALVMLVIGLCAWLYRRRRRQRWSAVYLARAELRALRERYLYDEDIRQFAAELSALLRRVSISLYPRAETASLTGEDWLRHLDQPLPDKPFSTGAGRILIELPYRRNVDAAETEPLLELCESWIDAIERRMRRAAP
jgi:hypothetical protein